MVKLEPTTCPNPIPKGALMLWVYITATYQIVLHSLNCHKYLNQLFK